MNAALSDIAGVVLEVIVDCVPVTDVAPGKISRNDVNLIAGEFFHKGVVDGDAGELFIVS